MWEWIVFVIMPLAQIIVLIYFAKRKSNKLSTRWLWFYTHIRLPVGAILFLCYIFTQTDLNRIAKANPVFYLHHLVYLTLIILFIFTCFGLLYRTRWGWNLNWWLLIIEVLAYPCVLDPLAAFDLVVYLMLTGLYVVFWFFPNAIYFYKRQCLFSGGKRITIRDKEDRTIS